jgi:hypothetical protein
MRMKSNGKKKRAKKTKKINGTVVGAFQVLQDGWWHSHDELVSKCGISGPRRARELRDKPWGGWDVMQVKGHEIESQHIPQCQQFHTHYRISPEEMKEKRRLTVLLKAGIRICSSKKKKKGEWEPEDFLKMKLTVAEGTFLLGLLTNNSALRNPKTKMKWDRMYPILSTRLRDALPPACHDPKNFFEQEE